MIEFKLEFLDEWRNKIIFAPNGFGKTTLSKRIKKEIELANPNSCLLFTRRQMDNLISFSNNSYYFGESAEYRNKNLEIVSQLKETSIFKDFVSENYGVKAAGKLKEKSLFFSLLNFTNLNSETLLNFNLKEEPISDDYGISEAIKIDSIINISAFNQITEDILKSKEPKLKKTKVYINSEIMYFLGQLHDFSIQKKLDRCPLCGKKFQTNEKLDVSIRKQLNEYAVIDENNPALLVDGLFDVVCMKLNNFDNFHILSIFKNLDIQNITFAGKIRLLLDFKKLCENNNAIICRALRNLKLSSSEVGPLSDEYKKNLSKIETAIMGSAKKKDILDFIKKEFKDIAAYCEADLKLDYENMSISVEGQDLRKEKLGDYLSESESKRLCLAVLRAMIKYGKYSSIILDDPIDSYDDYYLSVVCGYITKLLKERNLSGGYYIFTNNNSALHKISSLTKSNSIIIYEDPDDVFLITSTINNKYLTLSVTSDEVDQINKSELVLLYEYLTVPKNGTKFDDRLSYVAFATTIRNIKSVILRNYSNFEIYYRKGKYKKIFSDKCKELIEHLYMHYEPGIVGVPSSSATMDDIYNLYLYLMPIKNMNVTSNAGNKNSYVSERNLVCKVPFLSHCGNKMIALVFKKIIFVSELKFQFEKILLEKLQHKFGFTNSEIDSIAKCNSGFMKKVQKARSIDNKKGKSASMFLDDVSKVHNANSQLVNEFDHALGLMYPPYLNTRIFDIKKYKNEIERINSSY